MFSNVLTVIAYSLNFALLLLVLSRNLHRRLPVFTVFVFSFVARDVGALFVNYSPAARSLAWIYFYWTTEFLITGMYLFIIAEIAKLFLCDYPSIWRSASRLLDAVALVFTAWTVYSAFGYVQRPRFYMLIGDQRLLLTVTILILLVMAIGAYYRLKLPPLDRLVLVGIGIYAAVQVGANQIVMQYHLPPTLLWDVLRRGSFIISTAVWTYGVWRWAGRPAREPELISQSKYEVLSPRIHDRLRALHNKLDTLIQD